MADHVETLAVGTSDRNFITLFWALESGEKHMMELSNKQVEFLISHLQELQND